MLPMQMPPSAGREGAPHQGSVRICEEMEEYLRELDDFQRTARTQSVLALGRNSQMASAAELGFRAKKYPEGPCTQQLGTWDLENKDVGIGVG